MTVEQIEPRYITNVTDVEFPDGTLGPCYALVTETGGGIALSMLDATRLQTEDGLRFYQPHPVYPNDFDSWIGPDFGQLRAKQVV